MIGCYQVGCYRIGCYRVANGVGSNAVGCYCRMLSCRVECYVYICRVCRSSGFRLNELLAISGRKLYF